MVQVEIGYEQRIHLRSKTSIIDGISILVIAYGGLNLGV